MDLVTFRLLFVAGLIVMGVLVALVGIGLARLVERVRSLRREAATSPPGGSSVTHPGARSFWFERSATRRL
jgi:hypothetical protein